MEETKRDSSKSHMDAHASDLDVAMLLARRASGTRRASLMLLSERRDELYIVASSGVPPQIATRVRVCLGDDVAGMVAETGQPLLMNAWRSRKHRTRYHTSSFISVPVPHRDGSFGVLSVADPIAGVQLGPAELTLVEHIAQDIARGMEQAAHRSRARHFQQLMRQVPQHTAMVREEERARIAREMHDNVGSNLTAALFAIDSALAQLPREDPGPGATLERARIHLHSGITAVHDAVFSLHPAVLQREGLAGALRTLAADVSATRVLVLSVLSGAAEVREVIEAGADGYLLKHSSAEELRAAIHVIAQGGGGVLSPPIARALMAMQRQHLPYHSPPAPALSERERQILVMLAEGATSKEIAQRLNLSIKTIGNHRKRIITKLGTTNTAAAVILAYQQGLIEPRDMA